MKVRLTGLTAGTSRWRVGGRGPRQIAALLVVGTAAIAGAPRASAQSENVCDRTVQVRNAIEAASGGEGCTGLTIHHLGEISTLDLAAQGISTLRAGDFDGLVRLNSLDLSGNLLTSLPAGVFDELYLLKSLRLDGNQLTTLPDGIFDELFLLEALTLHGNRFTSMPDGLFEDFSRFDGMGADGTGPDNSGDHPRIRRFLSRHEVESPEEFIAALPTLYLQRFVLMYESKSPAASHVSGEHPRVVSWGAEGDFIFSWNTDPDAPVMFRESVEFLRQDEFAWTAGVIDFSGATPEITEPVSCQSCHGALGKPLWNDWPFWEGTEYQIPDGYGYSSGSAAYMRRVLYSDDPRLEPLDFTASSFHDGASYGVRVLHSPGQVPSAAVVEEAGAVWSWRHAEVLFRLLGQRRGDFDSLAEAVMCGEIPSHDFPVLHSFDPSEHHLHFSADAQLSTDENGILLHVRPDSRKMGYFYQYPGSIPGAVNFLLLADLWERDEMVRHLYRKAGNEETVTPGAWNANLMLHFPSGSATAEDELIQKLRLHFGRGGPTALEARGRQNGRQHMAGIGSSVFWEGHAEVMMSKVCSALRESRPRDLSASASGADVELSWRAPTYDPDALSGYRILRSAGGSSAEVLVADTASTGTTWTDESPATGRYEYAVRALYNDLYASSTSEEARVAAGGTAGSAAPSVNGPATQVVLEGETSVATLAATDEDTLASALIWSMVGGADDGALTITAAGALAFASAKDYESPDDADSDGTYEVTVQVSDGGQSGTADVRVTLSNRNEAPTADAGADQDGIEGGATVNLSGSGTDPDADDSPSYAWTQTTGTTVTLSSAAAAAASFTAPSDLSADETLRFTLRVTDGGGLHAEDEVAVTVAAAAAAAAPAVAGATTFTVMEGETAVGGLTATDEDTSAGGLTWSISGGADQGSFALGSAGALAFASAKDYESPDDADSDGTYEVTVQVSDGGQSGTADVRVTLSNRNEAPTADAGADQDGIEGGATVNLSGSGTDPDADDSPSYAWTQTTGTTVTLSSAAAAAASFTAPSDLSADETLRFTLRVTDGGGLHAEDEVAVTVTAASAAAAPAVAGATTFTVMEGETAVGGLTATDEDTSAGGLTWSISGGADQGSFALGSAGALAFASAKDYESPDDADSDGTYEVTVQVSDGDQSGTADVRVTLSNRNEAPTANAGADQDGIEGGATVNLSGSGTDPDADDSPSYAWTQTTGTTATLSSAAAAAVSFTAPSDLSADETLRFTLRVTDGGGLHAEDEVAITVAASESEAGLTARVEALPARHDGSSAFTFALHFSEEVDISYLTLRDTSFEVTGGTVIETRRLVRFSNLGWEIEVAPAGNADVGLTLPANRPCDAAGAVCTAGGKQLSNRLELTVAGPSAAPLTARLEGVPASHDGTAFRFRLFFSDEIDISYVTLRDTSLDVTGGSVTHASRLTRFSNLGWEITVSPDGDAGVRLVLEANRACTTPGAICTADGDRLSNRLEITVPAQP